MGEEITSFKHLYIKWPASKIDSIVLEQFFFKILINWAQTLLQIFGDGEETHVTPSLADSGLAHSLFYLSVCEQASFLTWEKMVDLSHTLF